MNPTLPPFVSASDHLAQLRAQLSRAQTPSDLSPTDPMVIAASGEQAIFRKDMKWLSTALKEAKELGKTDQIKSLRVSQGWALACAMVGWVEGLKEILADQSLSSLFDPIQVNGASAQQSVSPDEILNLASMSGHADFTQFLLTSSDFSGGAIVSAVSSSIASNHIDVSKALWGHLPADINLDDDTALRLRLVPSWAAKSGNMSFLALTLSRVNPLDAIMAELTTDFLWSNPKMAATVLGESGIGILDVMFSHVTPAHILRRQDSHRTIIKFLQHPSIAPFAPVATAHFERETILKQAVLAEVQCATPRVGKM